MTTLKEIYLQASHDQIIRLVILSIIFDCIFGILRAVKERKFNSSVGTAGAIRKVGMILSMILLVLVDYLIQMNLIGFVPAELRRIIGIEAVGLTQFFGLIFLGYQVVSILKNMTLCGLPVLRIWESVRAFLSKYTDELPDSLEQDQAEIESRKKYKEE